MLGQSGQRSDPEEEFGGEVVSIGFNILSSFSSPLYSRFHRSCVFIHWVEGCEGLNCLLISTLDSFV